MLLLGLTLKHKAWFFPCFSSHWLENRKDLKPEMGAPCWAWQNIPWVLDHSPGSVTFLSHFILVMVERRALPYRSWAFTIPSAVSETHLFLRGRYKHHCSSFGHSVRWLAFRNNIWPQETMNYSSTGIVSIPSTWHIVGAQWKRTVWHQELKPPHPFSFLTVSSTFPVNAVLISQETNEELTSPVRD